MNNKFLVLKGLLECQSIDEETGLAFDSCSDNPPEDFKKSVLKSLNYATTYSKKASKGRNDQVEKLENTIKDIESNKTEKKYAVIFPSESVIDFNIHPASIPNKLADVCKKIFQAGGFKRGKKIEYRPIKNNYYYYKLSPNKKHIYIAYGCAPNMYGPIVHKDIVIGFNCCENKKEITDIIESGDITVSASQKRLNKEETVDCSSLYSYNENSNSNTDNKHIERSPLFNKVITEYFDISHRPTRQYLLSLDEAKQNTIITSLTSKLYDKIVAKCDNIDYGEIPNTKGDITKLSKYEDMKETISIMHDLLKEYKQDTSPIDELSVAFSNIETRKDLFEKAYRYNSELPMVMYCNVVLGIITGISYMIATCVEFIKDPGTNTFQIALDKNSYAKTKDHTIYNTLKGFNKSCANRDFDKAMDAVMKSGQKNFAGAAIAGGVAIGVIGTILVLIPVLRELIFLFYYTRVKISDFFDIQADLLTINTYALEANNELTKADKKEIIDRQLKYVNSFRKIANTISFDMRKAEVEADKEKKSDDAIKNQIDDIGGIDFDANGSALF